MRNIPPADRLQLIALLEAIKSQDSPAQTSAQAVTAKEGTPAQLAPTTPTARNTLDHQDIKAERLGSGDVDNLMAQLIQQEKHKPELTKQAIYKWMGGLAIMVFLLVLIL